MQNPDEFLAALNIFRIKVHTPYPVGPVNSYLIKKSPYTLIDPGPSTDEARQTLTAGLAEAGVKPEQIERIVLTHYHTDHAGLANWLHNISGAEIFVHAQDVRKLKPQYDFYYERIPFLMETGLSRQELDEIIDDRDPVISPVVPDRGVTLVNGGELMDYEDRKIRVVHVPGHSSGHIGLMDEDNQIFFAGDFILKHITPNPLMEAREPDLKERLPVLSQYLNSVELFARLPIKLVLPGHGSFIEGNAEIAAKALKHHRDRLDYYISLINGREISAYQLMRLIYPDVRGFQTSLALSEVVAHLDYLFSGGRLNRLQQDGVFYYSLKH